mmetsp:Transcript_110284/g.284968  ORF Transcript_110284/g.284968 Transcript_110284/m.284968 type:complete len:1336 (+) Transcript_110284:80-4087(+)
MVAALGACASAFPQAARAEHRGSSQPAGVAISGLVAEVAGRKILKHVDAMVPAGALCAVMGASGSGKTSLIKVLAGVPGGLKVFGRAAIVPSEDCNVGAVGYLPQYEDLLPLLTVRETLLFSAALRNISEPALVVNTLLNDLALSARADARIGAASGGGLSGGERRRVSLAIRLLRRCSVLCADEPTSGLDSRNARLVVDLLNVQATRGCTVLCSIHQPRQEIFECFTHVLVLSQGRVVYSGPTSQVVAHVEEATGLVCPETSNPADFVIDASALDRADPTRRAQSEVRIARLAELQSCLAAAEAGVLQSAVASGVSLLEPPQQQDAADVAMSGAKDCVAALRKLWSETYILTRRAFACARRDKLLFVAVAMQSVLFGLVWGLMNWQLSTETLREIRSELALLFIVPGLNGYFLISAGTYLLCEQIRFFDDERHRDGLYSSVAFVLSQFLAALPLSILAPVPVFGLIYFMVGLRLDVLVAPSVFYLALVLVRLHCSALSILLTVLIPKRSFASTSVVANTFFLFCMFSGGFLTPVSSLPSYLAWFRWLSYSFHAFRWNVSAQFSDAVLDNGLPGQFVLMQFGFESHDFVSPPLSILGLTVCWLVLAAVALAKLTPQTASPQNPVGSGEATVDQAPKAATSKEDKAAKVPDASGEGTNGEDATDVPSGRSDEIGSESGTDSMASTGTLCSDGTTGSPDASVGTRSGGGKSSGCCRCMRRNGTITVQMEDVTCQAAPASQLAIQLHGVCLETATASFPLTRLNRSSTPAAKRILDDVCISFSPGQLTAIVGPSGAGKTSLLSVLAGRVDGHAARLTGSVSLGGQRISQAKLRRRVAVVGQEDQHFPGLTVQETINFYGQLRLPEVSPRQLRQRVLPLVSALGLSDCLDTRIGSPATGGISGGERRRLSVLLACLGEPALLLLDEPTTGLDALAAQQLVHLLRRLAVDRGQMVAFSVHQPRADLLPHFERILLLGPGGRILAASPLPELRSALAACGAPLPPRSNALDAAMDAIADGSVATALRSQYVSATAAEAATAAHAPAGEESALALLKTSKSIACPWHRAVSILLQRAWLNFWRQPRLAWARCGQIIVYALILVPVYAPLGRSQASVTSRIGLLYQALGVLFAATLNNLAIFPAERDVLLREAGNGLYRLGPFFLAYTLVEVLLEGLTALAASLIIVQSTGLLSGAGPQLAFAAVLFGCLFNGESIGIMLNSATTNPGFSVNIINAFCATLQVLAGFMATSLPWPLDALNHLSPQMYACRVLAASQFPPDLTFDFDPASATHLRNGTDVLDMLGLSGKGGVLQNLGGLAACCVAYRTLSFFVLQHRVRRDARM